MTDIHERSRRKGRSPTRSASGVLPGRVWLYSNYHCNLACSYCLTESSPRSERRELTAEQMIAVAEQARTLGFTALGVTGGEPFLLPWLPDTVLAMAEHLPVVLLTNGTLFAGDRIERAAALAHPDVARADLTRLAPAPTSTTWPEGRELRQGGRGGAPPDRSWRPRAHRHHHRRPARQPAARPAQGTRGVARGVPPDDHLVRPIVRRGRADEIGLGVHAVARDIPSELTITADGAFWGSFGPTVRSGRLDTDLLLTRTVLPLSVPANALLGGSQRDARRSRRQRSASVERDPDRGRSAPLRPTTAIEHTLGCGGEHGRCAPRRATASQVVDGVEVAGHRQQPHRPAAARASAAAGPSPVCGTAHRDPVEHCAAIATWRAQPDHPVAAVGGQPDGVDAATRPQPPRRRARQRRAGCPCRRSRPGRGRRSRCASRSSSPSPRWATTVEPRRHPRLAIAVEQQHPAGAGDRSATRRRRRGVLAARRRRPARPASGVQRRAQPGLHADRRAAPWR